ncbi:MAG: HAMP domain-containing histidine kinase [Planctomycetes bacterium]|nr:HAMP domain-containing histidine kinase [Planctomycetota bacterium]
MAALHRAWWKYGRALAVPLLLWGLVIASLWEPIKVWLNSSRYHDRAALREWIENARGNLPGMVEDYVRLRERVQAPADWKEWILFQQREKREKPEKHPEARVDPLTKFRPEQVQLFYKLFQQREKIEAYLASLAEPITKMYSDQLPLFTKLYRIDISFDDPFDLPIIWDSHVPVDDSQVEEYEHRLGDHASVKLVYQLHAYDKRQRDEAVRPARVRRLSILALIATTLAGIWVVYAQRRERERDRQRALAKVQVDQAERLLLQEELRRQEAERGQQQAERDLLQQRLAAQEYEQKMLELKSQLYASIGIMAGSYAHNIKNLLVRPNDLLRRCLEVDGVPSEQRRMLQEVRQTLGTVTERLQQLLSTVRRDPNRSEMTPLDLCAVLRNLEATWKDLARDRWKVQLTLELPDGPLWIDGDLSHLQQAVENLLFNARDATFEMRNHLRDEAREADLDPNHRRQALIAAAAWKGSVEVRARREGGEVILEVRDNGIGMTEEVCRRCTETHFSTKRDNAAYEGHSTGMGLGLSFVQVVLDNHGAKLEIESQPLEGATFRVRFPARSPSEGAAAEADTATGRSAVERSKTL